MVVPGGFILESWHENHRSQEARPGNVGNAPFKVWGSKIMIRFASQALCEESLN
jgi:hypothetical protein